LEGEERARRLHIRELELKRSEHRRGTDQYDRFDREARQAADDLQAWGLQHQDEVRLHQMQQMKLVFEFIQRAVPVVGKLRGVDVFVTNDDPPLPDKLEPTRMGDLRRAINRREFRSTTDVDLTDEVIRYLDARYREE
jgi:hypothetical protein